MPSDSTDHRESYLTIDHFAISKIEEKRSIFHSWASPIHSEQEARDLIDKARKQYPDARHLVYAWMLGGAVTRNKYSDDGEPAGTAGLPVYDLLRKNNIEDCIILVVRYFGGVLLGTGGLVRAYTLAAAKAVEESGITRMERFYDYSLLSSYSDFEKIKRSLSEPGYFIEAHEYGAQVRATLSCAENKKDTLLRSVADASNGRASMDSAGESYRKTGQIQSL